MKKADLMVRKITKDLQRITFSYNGKHDDEIDSRLAAVLEHDLGFEWVGQGYDTLTNTSSVSFTRKIKKKERKV